MLLGPKVVAAFAEVVRWAVIGVSAFALRMEQGAAHITSFDRVWYLPEEVAEIPDHGPRLVWRQVWNLIGCNVNVIRHIPLQEREQCFSFFKAFGVVSHGISCFA